MTWIQTRSGRVFDYARVRESEIDFNDVAYALANICRFNGHTLRFYSVLEHTVRMVGMPDHLGMDLDAMDSLVLRGMILVHDAHEAYMGDLVRPLKSHLSSRSGGEEVALLDLRISQYVRVQLGMGRFIDSEDYPVDMDYLWGLCRQCDLAMLAAEGSQLMCRAPETHRWNLPDSVWNAAVGFNIPLDETMPSPYWVNRWLGLYAGWMSEVGGV